MILSIVIPARNEADKIEATLAALRQLRDDGHEVIVVDGGSDDDTAVLAAPLCDQVIGAAPGRARQMNAGARRARGDVLLFLHADTQLPPQAASHVAAALQRHAWGRFDVRLSGGHPLLRVVERMMNWRSCITGMCTGDQAMFVRRGVFEGLNGFPELPLMEDIALSRSLKRVSRPACVRTPVLTSSRRWEHHGPWRTVWLMWRLRFMYWCGTDSERLAALYRGSEQP